MRRDACCRLKDANEVIGRQLYFATESVERKRAVTGRLDHLSHLPDAVRLATADGARFGARVSFDELVQELCPHHLIAERRRSRFHRLVKTGKSRSENGVSNDGVPEERC